MIQAADDSYADDSSQPPSLKPTNLGAIQTGCNDDVEELEPVTVIGQSGTFYWLPGGGFGGPVLPSTGGGSGPTAPSTVPNNPDNTEPDITCGDTRALRRSHARSDIGYARLNGFSVRVGDIVEIEYDNGQSELFLIECLYCTLPGVPVPGTCG